MRVSALLRGILPDPASIGKFNYIIKNLVLPLSEQEAESGFFTSLKVDTTGGFRAQTQRAKSTAGFSENLVFDQSSVKPTGLDRFFPGRFQSDVFDIAPFPEINKSRRALALLFQKIAEIFI